VSDPGNGNRAEHRELRAEVNDLWDRLQAHLLESQKDSIVLQAHVASRHLTEEDVEEIMDKRREQGRSGWSRAREYAQTVLAIAAVATLVVTLFRTL